MKIEEYKSQVRECDKCKHHHVEPKGGIWYHYCTSQECNYEPINEVEDGNDD